MARNAFSLALRDLNGGEYDVQVNPDGSVTVGGHPITVVALRHGEVRAGDRTAWSVGDGNLRWVFMNGQIYTFEIRRPGARRHASSRHDAGLSAPMPATVVRIPVAAGDRVRAGDVLITLEAMKMELPVRAAADGIVAAIHCRVGELVQPGQELIDVAPPFSNEPPPSAIQVKE